MNNFITRADSINVINLRSLLGKKYKIEYDEAYYAEYGVNAKTEDPFLMVVPCQYGHIYPQGGQRLCASTNKRGPVAGKLKKLVDKEIAQIEQNGDDGLTVSFNVSDCEQFLEILKPRLRRKLSAEHKKRLIERGRRYQFGSGDQAS